jgi:hypothetical protein
MLLFEDELLNENESNINQTNRTAFQKQRAIEYRQNTVNESISDDLNRRYKKPDRETFLEFIASLGNAEQEAIKNIRLAAHKSGHIAVSETVIDAVNSDFYQRFGDLLIVIETVPKRISINAEYEAIMDEWE